MSLRVYIRNILLGFAALLLLPLSVQAGEGTGPYSIKDVRAEKNDAGFVLRVLGVGQPTFTLYELFEPTRIVLDLADADFADSLKLPVNISEGPVSSINGRILDEKKPAIARMEILVSEDRSYAARRDGDDIVIVFQAKAGQEAPVAAAPEIVVAAAEKEPASLAAPPALEQSSERSIFAKQAEVPAAEPAAEKVEPVVDKAEKEPAGPAAVAEESPPPMEEESAQQMSFKLAGYDRQEITIDFYKIELHNVFRLFGEISGMNIVIAEGVSGTLTLALNNVPWDFALDLILNLSDLQKIERHGTIIIAPKNKEFDFAQEPTDNLTVKTAAEGLTIKKSAPPEAAGKPTAARKSKSAAEPAAAAAEVADEVVEAKKIILEARKKEKAGAYEEALVQYEEAYKKWPENNRLANRIASLYLVHQGMNVKAVHYAKMALKQNENDRDAALYAAIGLANMQRGKEAKEFFDLAVQATEAAGPPTSEALVSYASFNERNANYVSALLLLAQHEDLYGETMDTMVAKARIYEKEGNSKKAAAEYRSILLSGYELPADLARYIKGRLALEELKEK